jgi:hypothetical protein
VKKKELVGKTKKKKPAAEDLGVDGQQIVLELVRAGVDWINAVQDKDQLWTVVNTTMISPGQ